LCSTATEFYLPCQPDEKLGHGQVADEKLLAPLTTLLASSLFTGRSSEVST
jgi:hypothetical protein